MYMACHSCSYVSQTNNSHFYLWNWWNGKSDYRFTGTRNILTDFFNKFFNIGFTPGAPIPEIPAKAPDNAEILRNERRLSFFLVQDLFKMIKKLFLFKIFRLFHLPLYASWSRI